VGVSSRPWRHVPATMFQFTTTDRADLRIAVLQVFHQASVTEPALTFVQVRAGLDELGYDRHVDDADLDAALAALTGWQLLEMLQDHTARYATPEEFERRNLRWAPTPHGRAAMAGVLHSLEVLQRAVSLQPAALDAIGDALADLLDLLGRAEVADTRIATRLGELEHHLQALVDNVRQFNHELGRLQRDDATRDEVFLDVKQRVTAYLQEFVEGVERPARRIAELVARMEDDPGIAVLHDRALAGANLLRLDGEDPGVAWLEERARRWAALRAWFADDEGARPQIDRVLEIAKQAILALLRVLERRWESRRRAASLRDDLTVLARWFAACPTEDDAHRLFNAAFGMWPARHHHLLPDDPEDLAPSTSWVDAPAVPVAATLRSSGSTQSRGRSAPIGDPAAARAARQAEQAARFAESVAVRRHLLTRGRVPLAVFGEFDLDRFDALLELLAAALAAPRAGDGTRRAVTVDGQVEVVLHPPADPTARCRLVAPTGVLTAPAYEVEVTLERDAGMDGQRSGDDVRAGDDPRAGHPRGDLQLEERVG
jgi:uncharacterized protein (TIGR02677 family)